MLNNNSIQEIFYTERDSKYIFYLINHAEKRYAIIPEEYNGLCMNLYCSRESDLLGLYLSNKVKDYEFVDLDKVNG